MTLAFGGKGASVPVGNTTFEFQPSEGGHEVTFGRPQIAEVSSLVPNGAIRVASVMVRRAALRRRVIGIESQVSLANAEGDRNLARWEATKWRNPQLNYKSSPGGQVLGRILEARTCAS